MRCSTPAAKISRTLLVVLMIVVLQDSLGQRFRALSSGAEFHLTTTDSIPRPGFGRTHLLFPFAAVNALVDTGLSITNPVGNSGSGSITLFLFVAGAPFQSSRSQPGGGILAVSHGSGVFEPGRTITVLLSDLLPDSLDSFEGHILAVCDFPRAGGLSFIGDRKFSTYIQGYAAHRIRSSEARDLLLVYNVSNTGQETGIAIANATPATGHFDSGPIEFEIYDGLMRTSSTLRISTEDLHAMGVGAGAGPGGEVSPGGTYRILLRDLVSAAGVEGDFQGQIVARPGFDDAFGVNFIADNQFQRFAQGFAAQPVTDLTCFPTTGTLLFPFNTAGSTLQTGIAVANTSAVIGSPASGSILFRLFPQDRPEGMFTVTTEILSGMGFGIGSDPDGVIPAGGSFSVLVQQLVVAAGLELPFVGQIRAEADFPSAAGVSLIGDQSFTNLAQGFQAHDLAIFSEPQLDNRLSFVVTGSGLETGLALSSLLSLQLDPVPTVVSTGVARFVLQPSPGGPPLVVTTEQLAQSSVGLGLVNGEVPPGGTLTVLVSELVQVAGGAGDFAGQLLVESGFPASLVSFTGDAGFRRTVQGFLAERTPLPSFTGRVDLCAGCDRTDAHQDQLGYHTGTPLAAPGHLDIDDADVRLAAGSDPGTLDLSLRLRTPIPYPVVEGTWQFLIDLDGRASTGLAGNESPLEVFPRMGIELVARITGTLRGVETTLMLGREAILQGADTPDLFSPAIDESRRRWQASLPLGAVESAIQEILGPDFEVDPARLGWVVTTSTRVPNDEFDDPPSDFFPDYRYLPIPRQDNNRLRHRPAQGDEPDPAEGNRHALVVGVSDAITNAKNDVETVAGTLEEKWGFSEDNGDKIESLLDGAATKEEIKKQLAALLEKDKEGNLIFIYLAGHGIKGEKQNGFETGDKMNLTAEELAGCLAPFKKAQVVVAIDACYSEGIFSELKIEKNFLVGWAAGPCKEAHGNELGHDWTRTVFEGAFDTPLQGGNLFADENKDGFVSVEEALRFGRKQLHEEPEAVFEDAGTGAGLFDGSEEKDVEPGKPQ